MEFLIKSSKNRILKKRIMLLDDVNTIRSLNDESIKILKILSQKPSYPREVAKKLKLNEQNVYYYFSKLKKNGLIKLVSEEQKNGAIVKYYSPSAEAFGIEIKEDYTIQKSKDEEYLKNFFHEYIKSGVFDGTIVVGAPYPHGPYLTHAKDGHTAIHLSMLIGNFCEPPHNRIISKLDTEILSENKEKRNMILIGGPITNTVTAKIQNHLKIRFEWKNKWVIKSKLSGKEYSDEYLSIIAKIKNPWKHTKTITLFAGIKFEGTKASIIGITQHANKLLKGYSGGEYYALIRGLDKDGDGKTDDIKIIEKYTH
jgi:DNA-binding transcriptional ArsR family regulator